MVLAAVVGAGCASEAENGTPAEAAGPPANLAGEGVELAREGETRFRNTRQLTAGGENAEAYWSFDGTQLIYQARKAGAECDQIYVLDPHTAETHMVSTGEGRTTCSYFYP
ncbi:MAG: hypothetical protein R3253_03750, partial [Longimicrobiales bacterium]|nr:hypothetical protein [Longimicrobiales bacterium]